MYKNKNTKSKKQNTKHKKHKQTQQQNVPHYVGMYPHLLGHLSIWGCIPIHWGTPVHGDASPYTGMDASPYTEVPQYTGYVVVVVGVYIYIYMHMCARARAR